MAHDPDTGLVKRGLALLVVMLILVTTVLFIVFQGGKSARPPAEVRAEDYALAVALPGAMFPSNVSWAALYRVSAEMPSPPGWEIRYNALAALAGRGSDHVPWRQFRELLDTERATANARDQLANVPAEFKDAQETPEGAASRLVLIALKAVAEWHTKRREANKTEVPNDLTAIYAIVDHLADSPIAEVAEQAKKTQATFFRGGS